MNEMKNTKASKIKFDENTIRIFKDSNGNLFGCKKVNFAEQKKKEIYRKINKKLKG